MRRVLFSLLVAAALLAGSGQQAAAVNNQLKVDVDTATPGIQSSIVRSPSSGAFSVQVWVQNVTTTNCHPSYPTQPCGLGAYTLEMAFNPSVLSYQSFSDGPFLRSTGRPYFSCPSPTVRHDPANGVVSISCTTLAGDILGPTGSGHLATVTFAPAGIGSTTLEIGQSQLSDIAGNPLCHPDYTPCDVQNGNVIVNYQADLGVTKSAPASVTAPGNVVYSLAATNHGPDAASSVTLVDTLPSAVDFVSAPGCSYDVGQHKVTCDLGSMNASQTKNVSITVSVTAIDAGASLVNAADVTTSALDTNAVNNHAQATTQVQTSNIGITKTAPRFFINGHPTAQYVISVTSSGLSTAASVAVADSFPTSVSYVGHSTTLGSCTYSSGLKKLSCSLGDMAPSASATITVNIQFLNMTSTICNTATATWTRLPMGGQVSSVACTGLDTDGDFCDDDHEKGSDPVKGGLRDFQNPWDFYDVPVPTLHSGGSLGNRDSAVTILGDVLGVLLYTGTQKDRPPNSAGVDYDEDTNGDTVRDGRAYDRSVGAMWSGAPDDSVTILTDVLLVLAQTGHTCTGLPSPPR